MEKTQVVLLPCKNYEKETVYHLLRQGIDLLGGVAHFASLDDQILLKPNLVRNAPLKRAVITHPNVMEALFRIFQEAGAKNLMTGDSCGIGNTVKTMENAGMKEAALRYGVAIADFEQAVLTEYPQGKQAKSFYLAKEVTEADVLINVCKMKTHALERITGAVKNMYGCVSGFHKAQGHTKYPNADSFGRMLIDLNQLIAPRLYIMDGITAMEGNGPTSGDPIAMNVLLLSADPVALDSVFCRLIHLDPELVPTNVHGSKMGLGTWKEEEIILLTPEGEINMQEAVAAYGNPKFVVNRNPARTGPWMLFANLLRIRSSKPYIREDKCVKCGICVNCCPVEGKAIRFSNGKDQIPVYHYKKCIRCFCCQEMCPNQAIEVKQTGKKRGRDGSR